MGKFSAKINDWVLRSSEALHAVAQESTQRVIDEAQAPIAKGGRMPVDTAFLRNSCTANIGSMPRGNSTKLEGPAGGGDQQIADTLIRWKPGQTLYVGWVANYAPNMEFRYGFVRMATQNWQKHVTAVTRKMRSRARR